MRAAWHVEAFARTKKLPKLKDVLISERKPEKRQMTTEQLIAVTKGWLSSSRH